MTTWLVLDVSYLCWRAAYTTGHLSHNGKPTGVLYGFLRDVINFQYMHASTDLVFCFDSFKESKRRKIYPDYKSDRVDITPDKKDFRKAVKKQIQSLQDEILPELGFDNLFQTEGYEADDIIASVCRRSLFNKDAAILITADHDVYQLLNHQVSVWNPTSGLAVTRDSFQEEFGIPPEAWAEVKAIAGCKSDCVAGVAGVGEITAARFLAGLLKEDTKAFEKITSEAGKVIRKRNRPLVKLPFKGTPDFFLTGGVCPSLKNWKKVAAKLGINLLRHPIPTKGV